MLELPVKEQYRRTGKEYPNRFKRNESFTAKKSLHSTKDEPLIIGTNASPTGSSGSINHHSSFLILQLQRNLRSRIKVHLPHFQIEGLII